MRTNRVLRNTLSMFSGQSGAHLIALLFNIYLAHVLPDAAWGRLQFAIAYVVLFMVLAEFGLHTLLIRDIARDSSRTAGYFWNSIILKTILSVAAGILGWIVLRGFYGAYPDKQVLVYLTGGSLLFNAWYFSISAVFIGHQENHIETLLFFIGKLVYVVSGVIVVMLTRDVRLVAAVFTGAALVQCVIAFICLMKRHRHLRFCYDRGILVHLFKQGWLFFSISLFTTLHLKFDYVFIGYYCPDADLGYYSGAYNLVLAPIILANAFVRSMYPALAECFHKKDTLFWERVRLGFRWLAVLAFPVLFFMTIEGGRILAFVYKKSFVQGLRAMQILLWGQGLDFFCPFAGHILYVLDQQKKVIVITGLSVIVNVSANFILIPLFGTVGASMAMILSLSCMFWGYAIVLKKWFSIGTLLTQLLPPAGIAGVCCILLILLKAHVPFWINGLLYGGVCLSLFLLFRLIRWSDVHMFSSDTHDGT